MVNTEFTPFLQHIADDLFEQYGNDLSQVTIIAPNKRASLFFNQYLYKHVTDTPIWTPQFTTIGEVFEMLCPYKVADPIQQICKLYEAYKSVSGSSETLDKFYSWAELMMKDFEDIDNNIANAEMLFSNIEELENMKDFSFLSDNQLRAIRQYFESFNFNRESVLKERFMGVWKHMHATYKEYRRLLSKAKLCYSGMQKRYVVEAIKSGEINIDKCLNKGVYAIIGFNVLNETEKALFKSIKQERTTLFYWDYDEKFIHTEAGRFVSENIKLFGNRFASHPEYYRHLGKQDSIHFISSPTENAQTRFVNQWMDEKVTSHNLQESVVVLCNENILQPVLHSIPDKADGGHYELNVTMGYPLQETPIYSFVIALMKLQLQGVKQKDMWRYTYVSGVLKHPYTKRMIGDRAIGILTHLSKNNLMFPTTEHIISVQNNDVDEDELERQNDFLNSIFKTIDGNRALTEYLISIVKLIGKSYKDAEQDFEYQLYVESIFTTYNILNRIHTLQEREPIFNVNNSTLSRLLTQMLQQKSIPFHGEPVKGLQVMGLLETRNLDFRNVLMLSVNEGLLPKQERMASLIPYSLRETFGMTTIEKQVSLYAFYFYNLLQRAENVTLMYNSTTDGLTTGEMSRFMLQLQVESANILEQGKNIELFSLTSPNESRILFDAEIKKTEEIKAKLKELKFISPSAINMYIDCPVKFYFSKVAGFRHEDEVTEEVGNAKFGDIFHKSMELIYKPYEGRQILPSDIQGWLGKKGFIENIVDKAFGIEFFKMPENLPSYHVTYNGEQLLNRWVIIDYVKNQLKYDAQFCPMTILGVEKSMYSTIMLNDGSTEIKIGGIIDRYEFVHVNGEKYIRITDYKTNATVQKAKSLESIFDSEEKSRAYNYLQSLYYCDVLSRKENPEEPIKPALMYIKAKASERNCDLSFGKEVVDDYVKQFQSDYREHLVKKLSEIYLSDIPFTQHEHYCDGCEFRNYCKK